MRNRAFDARRRHWLRRNDSCAESLVADTECCHGTTSGLGRLFSMNGVDLALAFLLAIFGLRGYWRGLLREGFAFLALVAGVTAAFRSTAMVAAEVDRYVSLPAALQAGAAFVMVFVMVHVSVNLFGVLLDHLVGTHVAGWFNRLIGAAAGVGKGVAVLAFVLLFLHLFPVFRGLDERVMRSKIGPPLVGAASNVIRSGVAPTLQSGASSKT